MGLPQFGGQSKPKGPTQTILEKKKQKSVANGDKS